jgi:hypothetical protein
MISQLAFYLAATTVEPAFTPWPPVSQAQIGEGCYNSLLVVGTDNAPGGSGRSTTVVNIWAFIFRDKDGELKPLAWVYKNAGGDYWIQTSLAQAKRIRQAFSPRLAGNLLRGITNEPRSIPWKMPGLDSYDANFSTIGAIRQGCFSRDLPDKYY